MRTPLFQAEHSGRYKRQALIGEYQQITGANLIVVIDQITPTNMTVLEELLFDCDPQKDCPRREATGRRRCAWCVLNAAAVQGTHSGRT